LKIKFYIHRALICTQGSTTNIYIAWTKKNCEHKNVLLVTLSWLQSAIKSLINCWESTMHLKWGKLQIMENWTYIPIGTSWFPALLPSAAAHRLPDYLLLGCSVPCAAEPLVRRPAALSAYGMPAAVAKCRRPGWLDPAGRRTWHSSPKVHRSRH